MFPPEFEEVTHKTDPISPPQSRSENASASPATPILARGLVGRVNLVSPETTIIVRSRKRIVLDPSDDEEGIDGIRTH